jgi:hypothetical protein
MTAERDSGAFIGHEPELAAERIPGGVRPQDERVAATEWESAVAERTKTGWTSSSGPIGSAPMTSRPSPSPMQRTSP